VTATLVVRLVVRARFLPSLGRYAHSSRARSTASRDAAVSSAGVGRRREGDIPRAYVPASGPPETTSRNARIARVDGCDPIYTLWRHTGNAPLATHTGYASNTDLLYLRAWERVGQADYDQPPITGRTSSSQPHPGRFELADLLRLPGCYRAARGEVPVPTSRPSTPHGGGGPAFPIRAPATAPLRGPRCSGRLGATTPVPRPGARNWSAYSVVPDERPGQGGPGGTRSGARVNDPCTDRRTRRQGWSGCDERSPSSPWRRRPDGDRPGRSQVTVAQGLRGDWAAGVVRLLEVCDWRRLLAGYVVRSAASCPTG
jgi:hypothetical protein